MHKGRVSVVVPSRNERHLQRTIDSLLTNAAGDIELIVVLDGGPWPDPPIKDDKRVVVVRHNESLGMRPSINEAAQVATGEYLLKCDAHCVFADGYDEVLKADCPEDGLVVPTRHSLDGDIWERDGEQAAIRRREYNYHSLTFPFSPTEYGHGLHAVTATGDMNRRINEQRAQHAVDDIVGSQGSCWLQNRDYFLSFPPLDHDRLYFYQESQCVMFRILARGGRCVVSKRTHYAHWHKGRESRGADGRQGRGFYLSLQRKREAEAVMVDWCTRGWPSEWKAHRSFESIVEQHWWLIAQFQQHPKYAWPDDWRDWEKHRAAFDARTPGQIPAHT